MVDNSRIVLLVVVNAVAFVDLAVEHLVEVAAIFCNNVITLIVQHKSPQIQDV